MGIVVEYNPDLALRDNGEFKKGNRTEAECLPEKLEIGKAYPFRKKGQRLYWLFGEVPLLRTDGTNLSLPLASIIITAVQHSREGDEVWTSGTYEVKEIFTDETPRFNGFTKV